MTLVDDLKMTPQERLEQEQKDVTNAVKKYVDCKERIIVINQNIESLDSNSKDKIKRLKSERKQERKTLKTLHKNLEQQTDELALIQAATKI